MKIHQSVFVACLFVVLAALSAHPALATTSSQVPDPGVLLQANASAPGTKVFGTVSIFYTLSGAQLSQCADLGGTVDLNISMRALKSQSADPHTAGRIVRSVCYGVIAPQRTAVLNLVNDVLLPRIFPSGFSSFALKSADNLLQDESGTGADDNPFYLMMDFTLAVVPK